MTCHYILPPPRRGSHVKSDYARTIIQHTAPSTYTRHLRLDITKLRYLKSLPQPHHVTACHPSPGDKPPWRGRAVRNNTRIIQKRLRETQFSTYTQRLSTHGFILRIVEQTPLSSLCYPMSPSRHPSNLTSVYPLPALLLLSS